MLRGTCYRDMSETDPDFPEQFRTDPVPSTQDGSLQRVNDSFSATDMETEVPDQSQPMSADNTPDWAEQMQQLSDERDRTEDTQGTVQNVYYTKLWSLV